MQGVSVRAKISVPNSSDASWATDGDGRRWVAKLPDGVPEWTAEALGWLLSGALGVPSPAAGVGTVNGQLVWLSEQVPFCKHWTPASAEVLRNPADLGAMIALDAIMGNSDRHARNLLVRPFERSDAVDVYSIDLGHSWLGSAFHAQRKALEPPGVEALARGITADLVEEGARRCAQVAASLDETLLREFVREACNISGTVHREVIEKATIQRCREAPAIVGAFVELIRKRT